MKPKALASSLAGVNAAVLLCLSACTVTGPRELCRGVDCGNGVCVIDQDSQPVCLCQPGSELAAGSCVAVDAGERPPSPCQPNPCAEEHRTACAVQSGAVVCGCDEGYHLAGSRCVMTTPCQPNTCANSNQTTCVVHDGQRLCVCDPGHVPADGGCTPEPPPVCERTHPGDVWESDECPQLASAILATGAAQSRTIKPVGDVDWLQLVATKGRIYEVEALGSEVRPYVDVFDEDATTVLSFDHRSVGRALVRFQGKGTKAFIRIRAFSGNIEGQYWVSVRNVGVDDFPNDAASALDAPTGAAFQGALDFTGDVDVFRLPVLAGHSYRVALTADASSTLPQGPLELEILEANGSVRRSAATTPATIFTRPLTAGALFLKLSSPLLPGIAAWKLEVQPLGPDDCADDREEATPIAAGPSVSRSGVFERQGDRDVYRFDALAQHTYFLSQANGVLSHQFFDSTGAVASVFMNNGPAYARPTADGPLFLALSPYSNVGPYNFTLESYGADDHGNTPSTASALPIGAPPVTGQLSLHGDVDCFRFVPTPNRLHRVTCSGGGPSGCTVRLVDGAGAPLAPAAQGSATIEASSSAPIYVLLGGALWAVGTYSVKVEDIGVDDVGDALADARALTAGAAAQPAALETAGDADVFSFSAVAGNIYRFRAVAPGTANLLTASLLDAQNTVLALGTGPPGSQWIGWKATSSATLFVRVAAGEQTVTYQYQLEELVDDHGDTAATATTLILDGGSGGSPATLELPSDVDVFSFSARGGRVYHFATTFLGGGAVAARVVDGSGQTLVSSTPNAQFSLPADQTVFIEVRSVSQWAGGNYQWEFSETGIDDHGNSAATASAAALATDVPGTLDYPDDVDFFSFNLVAGKIYRVSRVLTSGSANTVMTLTGPGGQPSSSVNGSSLTRLAEVTGTWTVQLRATFSGTGAKSTYVIRVAEFPDDHANDPASATVMTASTPQSGVIQYLGDVDWFSFFVPSSRGYTLFNDGADAVNVSGFDTNGVQTLAPSTLVGGGGARTFFPNFGTIRLRVTTTGAAEASYRLTVQ